jgi:hypothetical protein
MTQQWMIYVIGTCIIASACSITSAVAKADDATAVSNTLKSPSRVATRFSTVSPSPPSVRGEGDLQYAPDTQSPQSNCSRFDFAFDNADNASFSGDGLTSSQKQPIISGSTA